MVWNWGFQGYGEPMHSDREREREKWARKWVLSCSGGLGEDGADVAKVNSFLVW